MFLGEVERIVQQAGVLEHEVRGNEEDENADKEATDKRSGARMNGRGVGLHGFVVGTGKK